MSKVIPLPMSDIPKSAIDLLNQGAKIIEEQDAVTAVLAIKTSDGQWMTGYFGAPFAAKAEAIAHLQVDMIDQMILSNIGVRY
jgi:hypothetical protein